MTVLGPQIEALKQIQSRQVVGSVATVRGLSILVDDLPLPIGSLARMERRTHVPNAEGRIVRGEVVGFEGPRSLLMLFGPSHGIAPGTPVIGEQVAQTVQVGSSLLGRVIDGLGRPIDGRPPPPDTIARPLHAPPTCALNRRQIDEPIPTGVRVIDAMVTLGKGQRVGIFSGPGVGKSTLLAVIARNTAADVNVIALIGERGREVREFLENALGPEGLARSVVVVATGDESPLLRVRAASVACAVAEHFRDLGSDVMLMMDSITRLAQAQRQVGLTVGEQPATKAYTPSVFAMLPVVLERAGAIEGGGTITGLYAVLVEGDDMSEPISDAARGVLDGHVGLARKLAAKGHYPAVDLLDSISRVADDVCDEHHVAARRRLITLAAAYAEAEELINIGAYAVGSNPDCDAAIAMKPAIDAFLKQTTTEKAAYPETCRMLIELSAQIERTYAEQAAVRAAPTGVGPPTGA
ncbi:MAG: FliI/YscN family ATPase [Phycisphaerales bacterium]|nr:MAG: FliI/YscN family ATPase [Phycisphaerales bacterium]